jgi:hypothetical protein
MFLGTGWAMASAARGSASKIARLMSPSQWRSTIFVTPVHHHVG